MNTENAMKYIIAAFFILILLFFAFILIRPIFLAIILGLVLAYIFTPINRFLVSKLKNETLCTSITCSIVLIILIAFFWFSLPILVNQVFDTYSKIQSFDTISLLKKLFPPLFSSPNVAANFEAAYKNFLSTMTQNSLQKITNIIMDLPSLIFEAIVVLVTFFFALRDGDKLISLIKESLPFDKSIATRFINKSKKVTFSVIFGRIVIGIITGILAGIGFYLAGVPNSLLLAFVAMIVSILPMIGPWIIWVPIVAGLFLLGNSSQAIFLLVYCLAVVTLFENLSHPLFVSKQSEIPTSFTLLGIISGMMVFGILGIIIGPLVVAYLLILFDIYREKNVKSKKEE